MLRAAMVDSGLSRYAISKATGIDQATLMRFANGAGLSLDNIDRLAVLLELELRRTSKRSRTPKQDKGR